MRIYKALILFTCFYVAAFNQAQAQNSSSVTVLDPANPALMAITRDFAKKISEKFEMANKAMGIKSDIEQNNLPEGESLLFNIKLSEDIVLDSSVTTEVKNKQIMVSLRDFFSALEFPIGFNNGNAQGWYIRENKKFILDGTKNEVTTDNGIYPFSKHVYARDDDYWVPITELEAWFDFQMEANVSQLEINLISKTPLPAEEQYLRGKRNFAEQRLKPAEQPLKSEPPALLEIPFVDVATQTSFNKSKTSDTESVTRNATIETTGDFAYGTLTTQSLLDDDEDTLDSVRATYKRESLEPELLGKLKARKFQLGDINTTQQPLTRRSTSGTGVNITNKPQSNSTRDAVTTISGYATPGWDADLFMNNQLLQNQKIGQEGRYNFENIRLFSNNNNFRVVLYGPQGEVREQKISIPVDDSILNSQDSNYKISVLKKDTQAYRASEFKSTPDEGAPVISAEYETFFGDYSLAKFALEAGDVEDHALAVAHANFATTAFETLFNVNSALDAKGEPAIEFITRKSLGDHNLSHTIIGQSENFDTDKTTAGTKNILNTQFEINGPLSFLTFGNRPRYNLDTSFGIKSNGDNITSGGIGINTNLSRITFDQQFRYNNDETIFNVNGVTTASGTIGQNRIRLTSDYGINPETVLRSTRATLQRYVTDDIDAELEIIRQSVAKQTEINTQMNWRTGHAVISPSLRYNTKGDVTALLNTRFGIAQDPQTQRIHTFDHSVTIDGGISVLVFLDKNGNGIQDKGEEPIRDVIVTAPQNGGQQITDEYGYAFFTQLVSLRLTDVYIEPETLSDPFWVPASRGVSILPREGHVSQITLPVLQAGEMDGTLYEGRIGEAIPAENVPIVLYTRDGKKVLNTVTDDSGYYLLSPIPPGDYIMLTGSEDSRESDVVRPTPRLVHIGYDGTSINGYNIYMEPGLNDAPVKIMASNEALGAQDPALNLDTIKNNTVVLNLGTYQSRLLMSVMWYKARNMYMQAVGGLETLVAPANSYADAKTGVHTLRLGANSLSLEEGTKRCGMLNAAGIKCTVEIFPGALQVAKL